jgi:glycosyltransferase involved in cell wall biosynthesis
VRGSSASPPLCSILINNYNYAQFLGAAIESALRQSYGQVEIVVVDDGSTDDSRAVISRYGGRIVPVLKPNGGQASAFNAGFTASSGSIVLFLDADDTFLPHKVDVVVDLFRRHPAVGSVFHPQILSRDDERLPALRQVADGEHDFRSRMQRGRAISIPAATSGMAFRRSVLARILPMPEAAGISLSDNFLKFMAVGLAPTFFSGDHLGIQRIHGANRYTLRADASTRARIALNTAWAIQQRLPTAPRFADMLFAAAMGLYAHQGGIEGELRTLALDYWKRATLVSKLWIVAQLPYYYLVR